MRVADLRDVRIEYRCDIFQGCLGYMLEFIGNESAHRNAFTTKIRTARSLRRSIQNAQLASHLLPSLNASGMTVLFKMSWSMGPSSPSTTRVIATASCQSPMFLMHTLTASFRLPPRRKNAAAYSVLNISVCLP